MNVGMLWFDNDPKAELNTKVERAVAYYRTKYGKAPTICFVHPSMIKENGAKPQPDEVSQAIVLRSVGVIIRSNRSVLPNHFWIGVNGSTNYDLAET